MRVRVCAIYWLKIPISTVIQPLQNCRWIYLCMYMTISVDVMFCLIPSRFWFRNIITVRIFLSRIRQHSRGIWSDSNKKFYWINGRSYQIKTIQLLSETLLCKYLESTQRGSTTSQMWSNYDDVTLYTPGAWCQLPVWGLFHLRFANSPK